MDQMSQVIRQLLPALAVVTGLWLLWHCYKRRVLARPLLTPRSVHKIQRCGPGSGIDRAFVEGRIAQTESLIDDARVAVAELERDGFEVGEIRELTVDAIGILADLKKHFLTCIDYPMLAMLVNGARRKAENALRRCRYFDRKLGRVVIPESEEGSGHCACSV